MKKRQTIKNIKRVSCRFDMDVPEERRAWQILQSNYQEPSDGKKQDYTSIIAKAMIGHYDRKEETHLTHEELLAKVQESIRRGLIDAIVYLCLLFCKEQDFLADISQNHAVAFVSVKQTSRQQQL